MGAGPAAAVVHDLRDRLRAHLGRLYPPAVADVTLVRLEALLAGHLTSAPPAPDGRLFDQTDVVLITYGDQVAEPGRAPLATLGDVLEQQVAGIVSHVHVLPFFPSTSDDGFAVVDHDAVDPALGSWGDVERLAARFGVMVDGVVNHLSASSSPFRGWLADDPAYAGWFVTCPPGADLRAVVRPRTSPLCTRFTGAGGPRSVWTTFSADQVDLDVRTPDVLLALTRSLLGYVAHGARMLRLDAIAFLWKKPGTTCLHLPQTHEVVRLWRTILDAVAPGTLLVTETNVPHAENVSYFGSGTDEAHLVYQFPLAPLVLSAFHLADVEPLRDWLAALPPSAQGTTFLNFLASHDGVGLRPVEGLLTPAEVAQLGELARAHGGGVSMRVAADGRLAPYELNTTFFDALTPAGSREPLGVQVDRFLSAHSILLALAGVPAIYAHSLWGSSNWLEGVARTGRLRTINREKLGRRQLERELSDPGSRRSQVFRRLRARIRLRIAEPAFHPGGAQRVLPAPPGVLALERTSVDGARTVLALHNVSGRPQRVAGLPVMVAGPLLDLVTGTPHPAPPDLTLGPYGVAWLLHHRSGP